MPFPYIAEDGFEASNIDTTIWNGTNVDTQSKLNVRHYVSLVKTQRAEIPYRGAYAAELDLSLGTADAYVESTLWVAPLAGTLFARFWVCAQGLVMASGDRFSLLEVQSAGPVTEGMVGIRNNSGALEFYAAETQGSATVRRTSLVQRQWHLVELGMTIDSGAANDGVLQLFVDGYQVGANITGLDQGAITQARLGAMGIDAGTTAGIILLDQVAVNTTRLYYPSVDRYPQLVEMTRSGLYIPGPGRLKTITLMPGGAVDNFLRVYDRDVAPVATGIGQLVGPELRNTAPYEAKVYAFNTHEGYVDRGIWVEMGGTNPRAFLDLGLGLTNAGVIREWAYRRPTVGAF